MPEESEKSNDQEYLLWDCFVNWSITLERIEKGEIPRKKD
jgi:hypothetical protein